MEFVVIIIVLCALGVVAARFGADSRLAPRSDEERAAAYGMTWADPR